jgi:2-keto-3-deoxy-6-phosphogluconate aldolase
MERRVFIMVDKTKVTKYLMLGLGAVLTIGANLVNTKNQDNKMNETIAEKVKEALENQTKES